MGYDIKKESELKDSDNWVSTRLCVYSLIRSSYRERGGTGHAICKGGKCFVHYDDYNPYDNFYRHIREESPRRYCKIKKDIKNYFKDNYEYKAFISLFNGFL